MNETAQKELLGHLYLNEDLTQRELADTLGKSLSWVVYRLWKFKIKKRDLHLNGKLTPLQYAYLAGFFDADGSFMITRRKTGNLKATMTVANKHKPTIQIISSWLSKIGLHPKISKHKLSRDKRGYIRRPSYSCSLFRRKEMVHLTEQIVGFLITKKKQAKLFLGFLRSRLKHYRKPYTSREFMIVENLQRLNRGD